VHERLCMRNFEFSAQRCLDRLEGAHSVD
jgi:hypothetical protein